MRGCVRPIWCINGSGCCWKCSSPPPLHGGPSPAAACVCWRPAKRCQVDRVCAGGHAASCLCRPCRWSWGLPQLAAGCSTSVALCSCDHSGDFHGRLPLCAGGFSGVCLSMPVPASTRSRLPVQAQAGAVSLFASTCACAELCATVGAWVAGALQAVACVCWSWLLPPVLLVLGSCHGSGFWAVQEGLPLQPVLLERHLHVLGLEGRACS
jgi:hypothetical protein